MGGVLRTTHSPRQRSHLRHEQADWLVRPLVSRVIRRSCFGMSNLSRAAFC